MLEILYLSKGNVFFMEEKKKEKKTYFNRVSSKKTHNVPHYGQSRGKTSVVIEKKNSKKMGWKKISWTRDR